MRGKHTILCLVLVAALLLPSYGTRGSIQAQSPLAGANMALPFARRSRVNQSFGGGHNGTDYKAGDGTPVVAVKYGQVTTAFDQWPDGWCYDPPPGRPADPGNYIVINHGGGYVTRYLHLQHNSFAVSPPNWYPPGTRIANADTTGTSDGGDPPPPYCHPPAAHLHFQFEINGIATDPYAGATNWAGEDPFPMGYRNQNHAIVGPFQLSSTTIRNRWLTEAGKLGSPIGNNYSGTCPGGVEVTCCYQGFERGYIYYQGTCSGSGSAQVVYYGVGQNPVGNLTFLPRILANENTNNWNSTIYIRNLNSGGSATVSISFYKATGKILDSRTYIDLPANGTWEISTASVVFDTLVWESSSFSGAAIVAADQDVAVVVRTEKSSAGVLRVMAYTGVSAAHLNTGWGQPGTTVYTPALYWHPDWTGGSQWESTVHVQNTTNAIASLSITYYDWTGAYRGTYYYTLPAYGQGHYQPSFWGNGFVGSAYLQADRALAVVVTQEDISPYYWGAMQYNAFSAGSTKLYLPSLMDTWYNWSSSFTVQNLGTTPATVQVTYYPEGGSAVPCPAFTLAARASRQVCQFNSPAPPAGCGIAGCDFPDGQQGTAIVTALSGQNLVAIVEQQLNQPAEDWRSAQSYSGFIGGGATLYGPFAAAHPSYDTCSHVQNVGSYWASITSAYFYPDGAGPVGGSTVVVGPGAIAMFYVPAEGVGTSFVGSVRITRSASQVAGILNMARKPAVDDFGASYNMPQR
jgi:murein DD-endopeptidase MepM/ murein hydrolase activator NlpD